MKVSCEKIVPLLTNYFFEDIETAARKEVEEHLEKCSECRQILADYKEIGTISDELEIPELPESFDSAILNMAKAHSAPKNSTTEKQQDNVIPFYNRITRSKVSLFVLAAASIMFIVTSIDKNNHQTMINSDLESADNGTTDNKTVTPNIEEQKKLKAAGENSTSSHNNTSYNNVQSDPVPSKSRTSATKKYSYLQNKDKLNIKGVNTINSDDISVSSAKRKERSDIGGLGSGGLSSPPALKSAPPAPETPVAVQRSRENEEKSLANAGGSVSLPKMSAPQSSANAKSIYSSGLEGESAVMDEDMDSYSPSDGELREMPAAPMLNNKPSESFNTALALYNRGNCKDSTAQFESFLSSGNLSSNQQAEALFYIGKCMSRTGKCSSAIIRFDKILSNHPSFSGTGEVKWDSAKCYIKLGQTSKAKILFNQLLSNPAYRENAQKELDKL